MSGEVVNVPTHLGLILDGNRTWAQEQGIPQLEGHRQGYQNLKSIGRAALSRGVEFVSAYAFSTDNWTRDPAEVSYLMDMLLWLAKEDVMELHDSGIRVSFLGDREDPRLSAEIVQAMDDAEALTAGNTEGNLGICLNYSGKREVRDAIRKIIHAGLRPEEITDETIDSYLYAPEFPRLDFLIRTKGTLAKRTSDFMTERLWYAEFLFSDKLWPEFTVEDLDLALQDYAQRKRTLGGDSVRTV